MSLIGTKETYLLRKINRIFYLAGILIVCACSEVFTFNVDCSECSVDRPKKGEITVKLTVNDEYPRVPLTIYLGTIENDQYIITDTATTGVYTVEFGVDQEYAVKAEYKKGDNIIYAVDGGEFNTKRISGYCDNTCFIITGGEYDVRLK